MERFIREALLRHDRIALQVSGGRDSIACLYLLRPFLHRITVYWNNTGDAYPETLEIIAALRALCPRFVEIDGANAQVIARFGLPTDLLPASRTPIGIAGSGNGGQLMQDRYSCCARTIMLPLHQRMVDDGITLVIRGQKEADHMKAPITSGHVEAGIEYLFPLQHWNAADVDAYLAREGAPVARFYAHMDSTPDCMGCSAWWENKAAAYQKQFHPASFMLVQQRLDVIKGAVADHIASFNAEVAA